MKNLILFLVAGVMTGSLLSVAKDKAQNRSPASEIGLKWEFKTEEMPNGHVVCGVASAPGYFTFTAGISHSAALSTSCVFVPKK